MKVLNGRRKLNQREIKLIRLAAALIFASLIWNMVIHPYLLRVTSLQKEITLVNQEIAALEERSFSLSGLQTLILQADNKLTKLQPRLYQADNAALAQVLLVEDLRQISNRTGVVVRTTRVSDHNSNGEVLAQITGIGSFGAILDFLVQLDALPVSLSISKLALASEEANGGVRFDASISAGYSNLPTSTEAIEEEKIHTPLAFTDVMRKGWLFQKPWEREAAVPQKIIAEPSKPDNVALLGIIGSQISNKTAYRAVVRDAEGNVISVVVGELLSGWQVSQIGPNFVDLAKDQFTHRLALEY